MKETIKSLRIRIDAFAKLAKDDLHQSRQVQKCVDELMLGKAWLGKALGELGTASPYPKDGERKGVQDIEDTAETANALIMNDLYNGDSGFEIKNAVERVDWLRQAIGEAIKSTKPTLISAPAISEYVAHNVMTHLSEARFWLGFELERQKIEFHTPQNQQG